MCLGCLYCGVAAEQGLENGDGILLRLRDVFWFGILHDHSNGGGRVSDSLILSSSGQW